jgi:DNA-binding IclR family transcriptional regulator
MAAKRAPDGKRGLKTAGGRRGIQSIEVGMTILKALAASASAMHLRELAAATGMTASKVYRYLVSFSEVGMVRQDPATGRYDLGQVSSELGLAVLERVQGLDVVSGVLTELASMTQRDVHTSIWSASAGATIIRWLQGSAEVAIKVREGSVLPLLTTATGRVWACYLPEDLTRPLIEAELSQLEKQTDQTRENLWKHYESRITSIRQYGVSRSQSERRPGIDALSGPIFGPDGIAFAVTIMGSHGDFDLSYNGEPARILISALNKASERFKGSSLKGFRRQAS